MVCVVQISGMGNKMSEKKCGLFYCAATVGDIAAMRKNDRCKCIDCHGENLDKCEFYKIRVKTGRDLQRAVCMRCAYYNGK